MYEYYCNDCRQVFEKLVRSGDARPSSCPSCGGARLNKMLSTFAAFSASGGKTTALAGGSCACGAGGACGCSH